MAVQPIAGVSQSDNLSSVNSTLRQDDFIKLFMSQLKAQDPLEPVNNQDFLAQMAQFSLLESSRMSNQELSAVRKLVESTQGVSLIGKTAETNSGGNLTTGEVISVGFSASGTVVSLKTKDASGQEGYLNDIPISTLSRIYE
ncbi:flagellar hook assembly protein FlgD [Vibrio coralliilyticus]